MDFAPTFPAPAPAPAAVSFSGRRGEFLKLLIKGSLLQIPTFGFYRFWLVTQMRRHLWANTRVGEEGFEYTGTAKEILIGFLIALAILVPINVAYVLVGIYAEERQAFASVPLFLVLWVFGHFAVDRARRYRATRTVFRGIRFWMTGSGWKYAGLAALWDLLTVVSLGLAYPWRVAALERYKMRHTYFGTLQGAFVATGGRLFRRAGWMWLVALTLVGLVANAAFRAEDVDQIPANLASGATLILTLLFPLFLAVQMRWRLEGIRFGDVGVVSGLGEGAFFAPYIKLMLTWSLVSVVFLAGAGAVVVVLYATKVMPPEGVLGWTTLVTFGAVYYLTMLLGLGVVSKYFLTRGIWSVVAGSLALTNPLGIETARAAGERSSGIGEGLADALDVGAI